MTIVEALFLGLVQGLTEFIPVSSSGHLVIAQHFMGIEPSAIFIELVNLGTFLALLVYFRKRIWGIVHRIVTQKDIRLARNIIISAVPVVLVGFFFADFFESHAVQNPVVVVVMLVSVGILMIVLDYLPKRSVVKDAEALTPKRALTVGLAQVISLIPGTSRSASTMIAGRFMGLTYSQAAEYSFLLSLPIMAGVLLKGFLDPDGIEFITENLGVWIVSNAAAFAAGLFAVGFMIRFLEKGNFRVFGYYRIGLATLIVILLLV